MRWRNRYLPTHCQFMICFEIQEWVGIRAQTREADEISAKLEHQHQQELECVARLKAAFSDDEKNGVLHPFANAANELAGSLLPHMGFEEKVILPLAIKHLTLETGRSSPPHLMRTAIHALMPTSRPLTSNFSPRS